MTRIQRWTLIGAVIGAVLGGWIALNGLIGLWLALNGGTFGGTTPIVRNETQPEQRLDASITVPHRASHRNRRLA